MIVRGRFQNHEEEDPYAFSAEYKKNKGRGIPSNIKNISPKFRDSNGRSIKDMNISKIECYDFHRFK